MPSEEYCAAALYPYQYPEDGYEYRQTPAGYRSEYYDARWAPAAHPAPLYQGQGQS